MLPNNPMIESQKKKMQEEMQKHYDQQKNWEMPDNNIDTIAEKLDRIIELLEGSK